MMKMNRHDSGKAKQLALVAAALVVTLATSSAAQASDLKDKPVYYAGGHLGINQVSRWPASVDFGGVRVDGQLALDDGSQFGLLLGRQTEKGRFEVEYQRGGFDLTGASLGAVSRSLSGKGRYEALTLNAYRFHRLNEAWTAYVGAGIGWGRVRLPAADLGSVCDCLPAASDGGLAYQGRIGLEYRFGDRHHVFGQYNWLSLPGPAVGGAPGVDYGRRGVGALSIGYRRPF